MYNIKEVSVKQNALSNLCGSPETVQNIGRKKTRYGSYGSMVGKYFK